MSLEYEPLLHSHIMRVGQQHINVQRFRGGLVFQAHRRSYHSTLGLNVIKKKGEDRSGKRFVVCKKMAPIKKVGVTINLNAPQVRNLIMINTLRFHVHGSRAVTQHASQVRGHSGKRCVVRGRKQ